MAPAVGAWQRLGVSDSDIDLAAPMLQQLGYDGANVEPFHQDAHTLGIDDVMSAVPSDTPLRNRAALRRIITMVIEQEQLVGHDDGGAIGSDGGAAVVPRSGARGSKGPSAAGGKGESFSDTSKGKGKAKDKGKGKGKGKGKNKGKDDGGDRFEQTIYLDIAELDPEFPFRGRLIGEGGRNVRHIREQTGASVWLYGSNQGFPEGEDQEAMNITVTSNNKNDLSRAMEMANDLLSTVYEEYNQWLEQQGSEGDGMVEEEPAKGKKGRYEKGKGKSKGKSKGKGKGKYGKHERHEAEADDRPRKRYRMS